MTLLTISALAFLSADASCMCGVWSTSLLSLSCLLISSLHSIVLACGQVAVGDGDWTRMMLCCLHCLSYRQ